MLGTDTEELPDTPLERALLLKRQIEAVGTEGAFAEPIYRQLRGEFIGDPLLKKLIPAFVVRCRDQNSLWAELKAVHEGSGAYAARRLFLNEQFSPLLDFLETGGSAADAAITDGLKEYDAPAVQSVWTKALERRSSDPQGAVTAACTLLEEVCKHIIEDSGGTWEDTSSIPKLYGEAAKVLDLAPNQHQAKIFKTILGNSQSIVNSIGALRNKGSDAHAGGRDRVPFKPRHAALAVNLAGSMALFLIETWQERDL